MPNQNRNQSMNRVFARSAFLWSKWKQFDFSIIKFRKRSAHTPHVQNTREAVNVCDRFFFPVCVRCVCVRICLNLSVQHQVIPAHTLKSNKSKSNRNCCKTTNEFTRALKHLNLNQRFFCEEYPKKGFVSSSVVMQWTRACIFKYFVQIMSSLGMYRDVKQVEIDKWKKNYPFNRD